MDLDSAKLAIVGLVALLGIGILLHALVAASRRRRAERAEDAASRVVAVSFTASADGGRLADPWRFDLADRIDEELGGAGEMLSAEVGGASGEGKAGVRLAVRLRSGGTSMAALRRALVQAGVPAGAMLSWDDRGIVARERLDRNRR